MSGQGAGKGHRDGKRMIPAQAAQLSARGHVTKSRISNPVAAVHAMPLPHVHPVVANALAIPNSRQAPTVAAAAMIQGVLGINGAPSNDEGLLGIEAAGAREGHSQVCESTSGASREAEPRIAHNHGN